MGGVHPHRRIRRLPPQRRPQAPRGENSALVVVVEGRLHCRRLTSSLSSRTFHPGHVHDIFRALRGRQPAEGHEERPNDNDNRIDGGLFAIGLCPMTKRPTAIRRSHERVVVSWTDRAHRRRSSTRRSRTSARWASSTQTRKPLEGTPIDLRSAPPGHEPFRLRGQVAWVNPLRSNGDNPNPGMGAHTELSKEKVPRAPRRRHPRDHLRTRAELVFSALRTREGGSGGPRCL